MAILNVYRDHLGHDRPLGHVVPPGGPRLVRSAPKLAVLPESEWVEFDDGPTPVPVRDQDGRGACFPAGTHVRMADGSERNIEDVRLLEHVVTAEGRTGRVIRTMARDADGLIRVSLWGHNHLRCTTEHPILTRRGYVAASELTLGDWVAMPRYLPEPKQYIHVADHVGCRVMVASARRGSRHFNAPEGRKAVRVALKAIPDVIEMTPGAGRLLGLFFAEGRTDPHKVTWTYNKTEAETLVAETVRLLRDEWGVEAHVQHRSNNSINVVVYGTAWGILFESLCGNGSGLKRLHPDVASGSREFVASMLDGWLDGDGHARRNEVQGVTISRDLALGMFDVAQALGRRPSIRRYHSPTYGTVRTRQPRWEISMGSSDRDTYRCEMDDTHVWRKVRGVELEDFHGPVFNLEVEGDSSYVAEGIGVHNCNGHAAATSLEFARHLSGQPHADLSPWFIYAILCNGIDRGSNIGDALELLSRRGTCLFDSVPYGTINPGRLSSSAHAEAERFRIAIGAPLTTPQEIMTAVQRRQPFNFSVCVGSGFDQLDADGCVRVGRGVDNHAVTGSATAAKRCRDGAWAFRWRNSWGARWGLNGDAWMRLDRVARNPYFEAYTVLAVSEDPSDGQEPPIVR